MAIETRSAQRAAARTAHEVRDVRHTTCCIVGAGPAGAVLALLLARQGIPVVLLEAHGDFDRDFRGDSLHPAILEILDAIGLADRLLELPHRKVREVTIPTDPPFSISFSYLPTRFPFLAMMPQARFLEFLTAEAARYPSFTLILRAPVRELIEEGGVIRGVRYQAPDGWHEVRALLTVAADGRFSRLRQLAGIQPVTTSQPIDLLWFRLPRHAGDPEGILEQVGGGHFLLLVDRGDQWQIACMIPKGSYRQLRDSGLEAFRRTVAGVLPWLADRVEVLTDWKQIPLLSVASDRLSRWYKPGLLLIGDAAHVMSPFGGNGINYAIQDAVAAANILSRPLQAGRLSTRDLAAVQRRRDWPTRITQTIVTLTQQQLAGRILAARGPLRPPPALRFFLRIPLVRNLALRWVAFGLWPVHLSETVAHPAAAQQPEALPAGLSR